MPAYLHSKNLCIDTPTGRPLVRDLSLSLARDRVALIGRNGVGKSTLLGTLAGELDAARGSLSSRVEPAFVRQELDPREVERAARWLGERVHGDRALGRDLDQLGLTPADLAEVDTPSRGQARKLLLLAAKHGPSELLLLDEPSEDLDARGLAWLRRWLPRWPGGALVVTHDRALLRSFGEFFIVAESGCRHVSGSFDEVVQLLEHEQREREQQYVRNLNLLDAREREDERIRRRRARKKNVGRLHELRRCTSRCRLNEKRSYAQESQARVAKIRAQRIAAVRGWARATRRALTVELPLSLPAPRLGAPSGRELVTLAGVGMVVGGRSLFEGLDLRIERQRLAIVGPNGAGKTTLLQVILGQRQPSRGVAESRVERMGSIAQGATDWISDDSLLDRLAEHAPQESLDRLAQLVVAHAFPLALAERPLRSLSPGERVRAALICLFQRAGEIELLVLDEPSHALDFVGLAALTRALRAWPGALVVVSHDRELLDEIGVEQTLEFDGCGGLRLRRALARVHL